MCWRKVPDPVGGYVGELHFPTEPAHGPPMKGRRHFLACNLRCAEQRISHEPITRRKQRRVDFDPNAAFRVQQRRAMGLPCIGYVSSLGLVAAM